MNGAPRPGRKAVYLFPGELHVAAEPTDISTLLGSCVAIALAHPRSGLGALCHSILPQGQNNKGLHLAARDREKECFKYVDCSLRYMLRIFDDHHIPRREIIAKIFGGADMFETGHDDQTVGRQNISITRRLLKHERLTISGEDVGGAHGRKLHLYSDTGEVLMKRLRKSDPQELALLMAASSRLTLP